MGDTRASERMVQLSSSTCEPVMVGIHDNIPVTWDFFFLSRRFVLSWRDGEPLPHFQQLMRDGFLQKHTIRMKDVFLDDLRDSYGAVSYRWDHPDHPDRDGEKFQ